MKLLSVRPWIKSAYPQAKKILLYGHHHEWLDFRLNFLKDFYKNHEFKIHYKTVFNHEDFETIPTNLFETRSEKKCYVFSNLNVQCVNKLTLLLCSDAYINNSDHLYIFNMSQASPKSKIIAFFTNNPNLVLIPCYEQDYQELKEVIHYKCSLSNFKIDPQGLEFLYNYYMKAIDNFSQFDFLNLYNQDSILYKDDIEKLIKDIKINHKDMFCTYLLNRNLDQITFIFKECGDTSMVGSCRIALQDMTTILMLKSNGITAENVSQHWSQGPVKFPYPKLKLYQNFLNRWSIYQCGNMIKYYYILKRV